MVFSMSIKEPYLPRYLLAADVIVGIVNAHILTPLRDGVV